MDCTEIAELVENGTISTDDIKSVDVINDHLLINLHKALPVLRISQHLVDDEDIEIVEEDGRVLGYLCACTNLSNTDPSTLSEYKLIAYYTEINKEDYGFPYTFKYDYLVLKHDAIDHYQQNYAISSAIWGCYQHPSDKVAAHVPFKSNQKKLVARSHIRLDTDEHLISAFRSTLEPFSLERYLKLYHLLELSFDLEIVNKIKTLGNNLKGIGQLLSNYQKDDISLLQSLLFEKCSNANAIADKMNKFFDLSCYELGTEIFFNYGKSSNPLKDDARASKFHNLKNIGGISENNFKREKLANNTEEYNKLIKSIAAYWVYRTRCCIAHNRIGEYIMTLDDEEFLVMFMEPLIREILIQVFSEP